MAEFKKIAHQVGDIQSIHNMTSIPVQTITKILNGYRNSKTPTGERIIEALDILKDARSKKIIKLVGNPKEKVSQFTFKDYIVNDTKAEQYFREYELSDGTYLPIDRQKEYLTNANIFNACATLHNNINSRRKAMGGTKIKGVWEQFTLFIQDLPPHLYPHSLPTNARSLRNKYNKYKKEGYESLIPKNFQNKSRNKKID